MPRTAAALRAMSSLSRKARVPNPSALDLMPVSSSVAL